MGQVEPAVQALVAAQAPHLRFTDDGRVECVLNGHTMPARESTIQDFIRGKRYHKLVNEKAVNGGLEHYEPFLSRSINFPGRLFCALTNRLISADMDAVKVHLKGKKFLRAKGKFGVGGMDLFQADRLDLFEEPDFAAAEGSGEEAEDGDLGEEVLADMDAVLGPDSDAEAMAQEATGMESGPSEGPDEEEKEEELQLASRRSGRKASRKRVSAPSGKPQPRRKKATH